jgi:hypothetical protein
MTVETVVQMKKNQARFKPKTNVLFLVLIITRDDVTIQQPYSIYLA